METKYVNFHSDVETDSSTYKNRVSRLEKYNKYLKHNFIDKHEHTTTTDLAKFLRLKIVDANSIDIISSTKPQLGQPTLGNDLDGPETAMVTNMLQQLQASEFVQLFLDSYMSPLNSDIKWRLGDVTATKIFNYMEGKAIYDDIHEKHPYAQYDEYGRIDTTANLRYQVDIPGIGNAIKPSKEYLVNYFFPPYTADAFKGLDTKYIADEAIKKRYWVDTIYNDMKEIVPCKVCGRKGGHWHYPDMDNNQINITYDTKNLLSLRENPTYRKVAFKPINDNISLLQHAFEYVSGIVSTYLTEWDISLYIQEGLLSDNAGVKPTTLTLCNRIMQDNPCGLRDSDALNFGVLNGAVSKLDVSTGIMPCKSVWDPSVYPLSTYWWPYETIARGSTNSPSDQLPTFYNTAKLAWKNVNIDKKSTKEKIKFFDERGAAYSGWTSWDDMRYYSAIYTTEDDGLSQVDVVHMCETTTEFTFCDTVDNDGNLSDGEIQQVINAILEDTDDEEYPPDIDDDEGEASSQVPEITDGGGDDDSGGGLWKTLKRFVRNFRKRKSIKNNALAVGKKNSSGFMSAMLGTTSSGSGGGGSSGSGTGNNGSVSGTGAGGTSAGTGGGVAAEENAVPTLLNSNANVNGQYSRQDGVSQFAPAIYGGPHGNYYSPKTMQAWSENTNPFLRDIPRCSNTAENYKTNNKGTNYSGVEGFYTLTRDIESPGDGCRSPSKGLSILDKGSITYTQQAVKVLNPYYVWMEKARRSKKKWGWLWWGYEYYFPSTYNGYSLTYTGAEKYIKRWQSTGYITSWPEVCTDFPTCPHDNGDARYEWENYYYYSYYETTFFTKEFSGYGPRRGYSTEYELIKDGAYDVKILRNPNSYKLYYLKVAHQVKVYEAEYKKWDIEYYKRPLLHAAPSARWRISPCESYSIQKAKDRSFRGYWDMIYNWVFSHSSLTLRYVYSLGNMRTTYRLSFPYSSLAVYRNAYTTSGENTWYPYKQTAAERDFIRYVLGNNEGEMKGKWVPLWFIQGEPASIKRGEPNLIFRAYCRTLEDSYFAGYWKTVRRKSLCRSWTEQVWVSEPQTANYIEIDISKIAEENLVLTGFNATPFTNIKVASKNNDALELKGDIPTTGRTTIYTSPLEFQKDMYYPISYPGRAVDGNPFKVIEGVGYTSILPWIYPRTDLEPTNFEDPNNYCCITKMGISPDSKKTIAQMMALFKFPTRNQNTIRWNGWKPSQTVGIYGTDLLAVDAYTKGFQKVLTKLITTSTFFRNKYIETYRNPYIIQNANILRTATKIALHQSAWLQQCKKLYIDNVDFQAVLSIIHTCVDKTILSRSIMTGELYDNEHFDSIYYHYWIDRAYRIFSNPASKNYYTEIFDKLTKRLDTFVKGNVKLVDKEMENWSYLDALDAYKRIYEIYNDFGNQAARADGELTELGDFMYSYLNVLYEYRKFFINKRCNKIDGTLWTLRELEGAIPMVTTQISNMGDPSANNQSGVSSNSTGNPQWSYKVDYYSVHNTNYDKVQAGSGVSDALEQDRTKYIFVEVHYVDQAVAEDYLQKVKENRWNEAKQGRYIYIPQVQKWAELPFDSTYRYESTEFTKNLAKQIYNKKANEQGRPDLLKNVNENIQECKFLINWSDGSGGLNEVVKGKKSRKILNMTNRFPYVYKKPSTEKYPSIVFNVMSGIDLTKVGDIATKMENPSNVLSTICYLKEDSDYWQIRIPEEKMPLTIGYLTNLSIKTIIDESMPDFATPDISFPGAAAGAFGYMLYPIIEEQANSLPGIGVDLNGISEQIKEKYGSLKI